MEPSYPFLQVVVGILLLISCAGKERFYFTKIAGSFNSIYGINKLGKKRIITYSINLQLIEKEIEFKETSSLTASAGDTAQ